MRRLPARNPITNGRLCIKCLGIPEYQYHPDRIIYPMKRDPKDRGKNTWERITWDEAYDLIEENYYKVREKSGTNNAVLTLGGTGREAMMFYPVISFADFRLSAWRSRSTLKAYRGGWLDDVFPVHQMLQMPEGFCGCGHGLRVLRGEHAAWRLVMRELRGDQKKTSAAVSE